MREDTVEKEFEKLFHAYFAPVKNFIAMLLKSEADAEDIAQDLFSKLWQQPDVWRGNSAIGAYVFKMAKNATFNHLKHRRTVKEYEDKIFEQLSRIDLSRLIDEPLQPLYYDELRLLIYMGIEALPEKRRRIFLMSRLEERSNQEIADALGISVRTVEHQIYLSLTYLRKVLLFYALFVSTDISPFS
jgi:RNA polymerase sigma-70 factor (ECF subfamily)